MGYLCFFVGGHQEFHRRYKELCEHALLSPSSVFEVGGGVEPTAADIDSHPASCVLPFLYLGNSRNAADLAYLQTLGTTCVLNVTSQLPGYQHEGGITYKQIPASDSGHQNLKQYFEEAFDFIGKHISVEQWLLINFSFYTDILLIFHQKWHFIGRKLRNIELQR